MQFLFAMLGLMGCMAWFGGLVMSVLTYGQPTNLVLGIFTLSQFIGIGVVATVVGFVGIWTIKSSQQ